MINIKKINNKSGFSLVELLMGIGLLAILLLSANVLMFTSFKSARKASAITLANSEGTFALKSMEQLVRFATRASCNATRTQLTVQTLGSQSVLYEFTNNRIASTSGGLTRSLTSSRVWVLGCPGGGVFTCSADNRTVNICFAVENAAGTDPTTLAAGSNGILFRSQVLLRNWGY